MIRKKLVISYIIFMTLFLAVIMLTSFNSLTKLFYHENAILYEIEIGGDQDKVQTIIHEAETYNMLLCTDSGLQDLLDAKNLPDAGLFHEAVAGLSRVDSGQQITVLPIIGEEVYRVSADGTDWLKASESLAAYSVDYRYHWIFRPSGKDVIRVQRVMYDDQDISMPLAVVLVDINIPSFSDIFYTFGADSNLTGALYLTDASNQCLLPITTPGVIELNNNVFPDLTDAMYDLHDQQITIVKGLSNGWKLIAVIDGSSLLTGVHYVMRTIVIVGLVVEVLGMITIYIMTAQITDPLMNLSQQIKEAAEKEDYQPLKVPRNAKGEVMILYDSYNDLVSEVNKSIEKIQEASQRENENQFMLLQAQINPHFLYNTLNTISFMAQNGQTEDIQKVVMALVNIFRTSLNNGKPEVTVEQEIGHVASYLEIMHYRYPDSYSVNYDIQSQTRDLKIIKQILQPLAENALTHGFFESGIKGIITIRSYLQNEELILSMANTGIDIDMELVNKLLAGDEEASSKHYGIRNVNSRLIDLYGAQSGLRYKVVGGETIVEIHIPLEKIRQEVVSGNES